MGQKPIRKIDVLEKQNLYSFFLFKTCDYHYRGVTWAMDINFKWNKLSMNVYIYFLFDTAREANTLGFRQNGVQILGLSFNSWGQLFTPTVGREFSYTY